MKSSNPIVRRLCLTVLSMAPVIGALQSATELEIGPDGSDQVSGYSSGAIGDLNTIAGLYSSAFGYDNDLPSSATASVAVGAWNTVGGLWSMAIGQNNNNAALATVVIGAWSSASYDPINNSGWNSLLVGNDNFSFTTNQSLLVGLSNRVDSDRSATLGYGLTNYWDNSTVVGKFNDSAASAGLVFAVGNGTGEQDRSNALEVHQSGEIRMPKQGDILMGQFGVNGD